MLLQICGQSRFNLFTYNKVVIAFMDCSLIAKHALLLMAHHVASYSFSSRILYIFNFPFSFKYQRLALSMFVYLFVLYFRMNNNTVYCYKAISNIPGENCDKYIDCYNSTVCFFLYYKSSNTYVSFSI